MADERERSQRARPPPPRHPHSEFDPGLRGPASRLLYLQLGQHARHPGGSEEQVDRHVLFGPDGQLAVSGQTLLQTEHALELREKKTFIYFYIDIDKDM